MAITYHYTGPDKKAIACSDGTVIPVDTSNLDYQEFAKKRAMVAECQPAPVLEVGPSTPEERKGDP